MNESSENSNNSGGNDLETLDYLRGVKSSTCLLLPTTPSPTPLDFKHPLSEEMSDRPFLGINDEPNMVNIQTDASAGDSSSSGDSNSVVQDPVSAQLINNISMLDYQTLSKNGDLIIGQTEDCKLNGNHIVNNRKLPNFVNWNWSVIRHALLWVVCSGLLACIAAIAVMVVNIPKECNPDLPWHQGKVFYEVFPASFEDSNQDGIGDLKGLIQKLDYVQDLGASAIRLNYIFQASNYPQEYQNITSLIQLDKKVGDLQDFRALITEVHQRNMSLILDLPVVSMAKQQKPSNFTKTVLISNESVTSSVDPTSAALIFWAKEGVNGFYLKDLEEYVDDVNFGRTLRLWKEAIGSGKILIASEKALEKAKGDSLTVLLSRIDLIDVHLNLKEGINGLKLRIESVTSGILWQRPHYPWVHWNVGSIDSKRISLSHANNTLALTVLEFVLPGTVSLFYGDEIGLGGIPSDDDKNSHNLVQMLFSDSGNKSENVLSENEKGDLEPNLNFLEAIKSFTNIKLNTPTIYLRATYKEGKIQKNIAIRETNKDNKKAIENDLIIIERWFPRRNTCVFIVNLGNKSITTDLTSMFYGGTVIASTNATLVGEILYFDKVTFYPNSAVLLKLEK